MLHEINNAIYSSYCNIENILRSSANKLTGNSFKSGETYLAKYEIFTDFTHVVEMGMNVFFDHNGLIQDQDFYIDIKGLGFEGVRPRLINEDQHLFQVNKDSFIKLSNDFQCLEYITPHYSNLKFCGMGNVNFIELDN